MEHNHKMLHPQQNCVPAADTGTSAGWNLADAASQSIPEIPCSAQDSQTSLNPGQWKNQLQLRPISRKRVSGPKYDAALFPKPETVLFGVTKEQLQSGSRRCLRPECTNLNGKFHPKPLSSSQRTAWDPLQRWEVVHSCLPPYPP